MAKATEEELVFLPLGGAGEIGMNLNLYGYGPRDDYKWVMVDFGITFPDEGQPGIDVITPDPAFIEERRDDLMALVLTHAHEDHLGAVPYLWPRLRCPIYATPFTASVLKRKLEDTDFGDEVPIHVIPMDAELDFGPFHMRLITLTHSIPEPNAIAITTPKGTILHTGDWKFDPDPVIGPTSDEEALRALGDDKVLAMVCDSTNVFNSGTSGSEADLFDNLKRLIGEAKGRVAVTCFASNVARLETIAKAAEANRRTVVLVGRSMWRFYEAARENGYLKDIRPPLRDEDGEDIPKDHVCYICTGSQGEPRAALSRIAALQHPYVELGEGDTVIFSSRVIPGNEIAIGHLQNDLAKLGIKVVTDREKMIHVSGHPARDELAHMYQLVRPQIAIPVHGEPRHLREHADLARDCQVKQAVVVENGSMVRIEPAGAEIIDHVYTGRLYQDGTRMIQAGSEIVRERKQTAWHGSATVSVVLNGKGRLLAEPEISFIGILDEEDEEDMALLEEVRGNVVGAIDRLKKKDLERDITVKEVARLAARRCLRDALDKNVVVKVHLIRVEG